jgi:type IV pilus assembly protein PilY1
MLGLPESFPACIGTADNLISYILGTDFNGCRSRMLLNGNTYKLGDILNSSPVMVDYPNKTGKPGYTMTYVGANDGMLHAFRAGKVLTSGLISYQAVKLCNDSADCSTDKIGREEWAFIPKNALPYLRYLADPDYCHIYYNDLSPYILEIKDSAGYVTKRILIGGMRLGGACGTTASSTVKPPLTPAPILQALTVWDFLRTMLLMLRIRATLSFFGSFRIRTSLTAFPDLHLSPKGTVATLYSCPDPQTMLEQRGRI